MVLLRMMAGPIQSRQSTKLSLQSSKLGLPQPPHTQAVCNLDLLILFGPKMALAVACAISWAKKVSGPSKSLDFMSGPFRILEIAPFSDFQGLIS